MSFIFVCSACRHRLSGQDHHVGAQVRCPGCGVSLEVPDPRQVPAGTGSPGQAPEGGEMVAEESPVRFRSYPQDREADMDMTPMVDVTFLLLIFFMVTAAFTMQKSFEIPTPDEEQASERPIRELEDDSDYVIVRVDEFNTYHVSAATWEEEKEAPSEQDLLVRLREARRGPAGKGATRMLVMANGEARHEKVVTALDAGAEVGMEDVKLVTVEDDG